ncbi:sensor domain-containing diguanylate cyclase [Desulfuromonas sp.]|uniref:sensor domain-containing diguanylate cyclase n=1 Tax=Desulfuromonas sp. TaxID=892 RepID=UPI0025B81C80|nr:sensor domain-containing diguanylate cyclase [Desulfuromonas sp.]
MAELAPDLFKQMLDNLAEGVYYVDTERRLLYWNRAAEKISGYSVGEILHKQCFHNILDHVDGRNLHLCKSSCPLTDCLESGRGVEKRVFLRHKEGHRVPVAVKVAPIRDGAGVIAGAVEIFSDATATLQVEELNDSLQKMLRIDPLTQVANRRALLEALQREKERYDRYGTAFSVIFADIDHFKRINDVQGHLAGDRALRWFAGQLRSGVRRTDLVGRYGGEEFVVLLPETEAPSALCTADLLRQGVAGGTCAEADGTVTACFGVAAIRPGDSVDDLLQRADAAMYRSKQEGRNRVSLEA